MAASVIRNFLIPAPTPAYFPLILQSSPYKEDEEMLEEQSEMRASEEEREVEEEEEDEESEAQEEEEECLEEAFLNPVHCAFDVTKQLLRFAELISRDVQRYFGRCSGDQEACDVYSDSASITPGGRLRYYDDLLKIARARTPEEPDDGSVSCTDDPGAGGLGPLAELFKHRGLSQGRGQPMIKRHLPLSFWTEPTPCCSRVSFREAPDIPNTGGDTHSQDGTHTERTFTQHHTHSLESPQLDFSDLLAYWDPNPEPTLTTHTDPEHTLTTHTDNTH